MSEHRVDVVPVQLEKHPNADSLSIVRVKDYTVIVRTEDWINVHCAAYIEPDYIVPANRPEFEFLSKSHKMVSQGSVNGYRIKVKKLRGVVSMGLLVSAPEGSVIGDNVIEQLGIVRYEPQVPVSTFGESTASPPGIYFKYDVESAYKYSHLFEEGQEVVVTEKVHGASGRWVYIPELGMFCGSRTEWKKKDPKNLWWKALAAHPQIEEFCKANPGITVYGEVYGQVQDLKYGAGSGQVNIVVFDLLRNGNWIDYQDARGLGILLVWAPEIYRGPWNKEKIFALADGKSIVAGWRDADQIREGIVVKPIREQTNLEIGRTQLKIVSNAYLERV